MKHPKLRTRYEQLGEKLVEALDLICRKFEEEYPAGTYIKLNRPPLVEADDMSNVVENLLIKNFEHNDRCTVLDTSEGTMEFTEASHWTLLNVLEALERENYTLPDDDEPYGLDENEMMH